MRADAVALLCVIAAATPAPAAAQWRSGVDWMPAAQADEPAPPSLVTPTLLSAALPGAGQHVLGQGRKWAYLAVEVAAWALWIERRASAGDYRNRYRDYAWDGARIQAGSRVDGDFDYYERMSKWTRSGAFDADASTSGVQPELDASTYNGSVWSLASQIYISGPTPPASDPAYQSALAYYQQRAYGPEFLWDWTAGSGERTELDRLIGESDSRFGHATTALGAVIANHILSAADAYLSARGRRAPARLRVVPALASGRAPGGVTDGTGAWLLVLSVGLGR